MEGCSKYCSYCVVPYTRGEEVSRPFDDVLAEVAGLADQGVKEVTLLGQNVNAYRGAMGETAEIADFALLIEYVAEIPGIERIRYTTSHPNEFTQRLIDVYGRVPKLVEPPAPAGAARQRPHPDGDEARLHRAWNTRARCASCARCGPASRISSDFIVGFPGETDDDFGETMKLIDDVGFDHSFSFVFSPRPGTPAAALPDDTPHDGKARAPAAPAGARSRPSGNAHQRLARSAPSSGSWSKAARARTPSELMGRTECNRVVNFAAADAWSARWSTSGSPRCAALAARRACSRLKRPSTGAASAALAKADPPQRQGAGDDHRRVGRHPAVVPEDHQAGDQHRRHRRARPAAEPPQPTPASSRRHSSLARPRR